MMIGMPPPPRSLMALPTLTPSRPRRVILLSPTTIIMTILTHHSPSNFQNPSAGPRRTNLRKPPPYLLSFLPL